MYWNILDRQGSNKKLYDWAIKLGVNLTNDQDKNFTFCSIETWHKNPSLKVVPIDLMEYLYNIRSNPPYDYLNQLKISLSFNEFKGYYQDAIPGNFVFTKPISPYKPFKGGVYHKADIIENFERWVKDSKLTNSHQILIAPTVEIEEEYLVIVDYKFDFVTGCLYKKNGIEVEGKPDDIPQDIIKFLEYMVLNIYRVKNKVPMVALQICRRQDGVIKIADMEPVNTINLRNIDYEKFILKMEELSPQLEV